MSRVPREKLTYYDPSLTLADVEIEWIKRSLKFHQGCVATTSRSLGIGRSTLTRAIKKHKLENQVWAWRRKLDHETLFCNNNTSAPTNSNIPKPSP